MARTSADSSRSLPFRNFRQWIPALLLSVTPMFGATIHAAGTLQSDDEVASASFSVLSLSNVSVSTSSYGAGGFFPVFSLFRDGGTGELILVAAGNLGVCEAGMTPPPGQVNCEDIRWSGLLAPGAYLATLTVYPNLPLGPDRAAGFLFDGAGNFTSMFGGTGPFLEPDGTQKTGLWNITIAGDVEQPDLGQPVPEPGTLAGLTAGLTLIAILGAGRRHNLRRK